MMWYSNQPRRLGPMMLAAQHINRVMLVVSQAVRTGEVDRPRSSAGVQDDLAPAKLSSCRYP